MFSFTAMPVKLPSEKKKRKTNCRNIQQSSHFLRRSPRWPVSWNVGFSLGGSFFVGQHMGRHGNPVRRGQIGIDKKKSNNNCEVVCCSWTHRPGGAWSSANAVD